MSNRMRIGDDVVMAYVDNALPVAAAEKIKPFIEADHDCRRRAAALQEIRRLAHSAFQDVLEEPLPQELRRVVTPPPEVQEEAASVPLERRPKARTSRAGDCAPPGLARAGVARRRASHWRLASLAGVLLLASLSALAGFWLGQERAATPSSTAQAAAPLHLDSRILPGGALFTALETKPSGQRVREGLLEAQVRLSFWDAGGRICRQYEVRGGASALIGVACRLPDSRWQPQVVVEGRFQDGVLRTLPGGRDELQGYILRTAGSGRLSAAEESDLIARGW